MIKLNLGCGVYLIKGYINVDNFFDLADLKTKKGAFENAVIEKGAKFLRADFRKLPFKDNSVDEILSVDAIEHQLLVDVYPTILEWKRVLKKGGKLRIATLNFDEAARLWINHIADKDLNWDTYYKIASFVYGNQRSAGECHQAPITPKFLYSLMQSAKFENFRISVYPTGSPYPRIKGYFVGKDATCLIETVLCEAIK